MNFLLVEGRGDILLISQFTLFANTKKGNHPSFIKSASLEFAEPMHNVFKSAIEKNLEFFFTGQFAQDIQVFNCNDGPVTINVDSKIRE